MYRTFEQKNLEILKEVVLEANQDNIGDSYERALVLAAASTNPDYSFLADKEILKLRDIARLLDIGSKIYSNPPEYNFEANEIEMMQLIAIVGALTELIYCFESVEQASKLTFEYSVPVRFYINSMFHYLTALFLLDIKTNKKKGLENAGTIIKVFQPLGLNYLLTPLYEIFNSRFGSKMTYGDTILKIRNSSFVHGNFSPKNIKDVVLDSEITKLFQREEFIFLHVRIYDQIIILRLKLLSILTELKPDLTKFSTEKIYES